VNQIISQREAHRLRRQVERLQRREGSQRAAWSGDFGDGWVHIASMETDLATWTAAKTARRLGHAVVVVLGSERALLLYAAPVKE
jgi:hypothetical protein